MIETSAGLNVKIIKLCQFKRMGPNSCPAVLWTVCGDVLPQRIAIQHARDIGSLLKRREMYKFVFSSQYCFQYYVEEHHKAENTVKSFQTICPQGKC